jgi:hypothetical protein
MVLKTHAAVIGFFQFMALDHRAHGAVEDKDAFLYQPAQ